MAEKHCEAFGKVSVFNTYPDKRRVKFWCGNRKKWLRQSG